jgi:hypothetical protein
MRLIRRAKPPAPMGGGSCGRDDNLTYIWWLPVIYVNILAHNIAILLLILIICLTCCFGHSEGTGYEEKHNGK